MTPIPIRSHIKLIYPNMFFVDDSGDCTTLIYESYGMEFVGIIYQFLLKIVLVNLQ